MTVLLAASVPPPDVELAGFLLWEHGATAIEERIGHDSCLLVAGFPDDSTRAAALEVVGARWPVHAENPDDGYLDRWREFAQPVRLGRLVVRPAWVDYESTPGELVVSIDPGRSFGAGNHPTTQLALAALAQYIRPGVTVLDVGCGSGVLSIAAVLLGAGSSAGIDVEAQAVVDTNRNASRNGVEDRVSASTTPLAGVHRQFDVVVANLGGEEQPRSMMPLLAERLVPGGTLIVSGMLASAFAGVRAAMAAAAAVSEDEIMSLDLEGWTALVAVTATRR